MSNEHVEPTVRSILDTICPPAGATTGATMGQPVKPVEVSDDQNTVTVTVTTRLEFVHAKSNRCRHCDGGRIWDICDKLPCGSDRRKDGLSGYFREVE